MSPSTQASPAMALLCGVILLLLPACQARKLPGGSQAHHHHHVPCFSQEQLQAGEVPMHYMSRAVHWDRYTPVQMVPYLEQAQRDQRRRQRRHPKSGCPALQLTAGAHSEANERSISPWQYRIDEDENRYPPKLAFAECLCNGCIDTKTGRETTALNSVLIHQTMMVLRRKPCPRDAPATFAFDVDYIRVPVGCTCVLPRTAH